MLACCGSSQWVREMLATRPFESQSNLEARAIQTWWRLDPNDWLEAFSKHPKIGEKGKVSQWSAQEQSGMNAAAATSGGTVGGARIGIFRQVRFYLHCVCHG